MIVWLISYPRSGNTLTRSVFKHFFGLGSFSIYGDKWDIGSSPELSKLVGHREGDISNIGIAAQRAKKRPVLIKSHEGPNSTMSLEDLYIHIVRDGRDSNLSYYHYVKDFARRADVSLDDVISGRVRFGSWGHHTCRWYQATQFNIMRFRFEDIVADVNGFAKRLEPLIGLPMNSEPFPEIDNFRRALPNFVRSGEIGGWRKAFTPQQLALFSDYNGVAMRLIGYWGPQVTRAEVDAYAVFCSDIEAGRLRDSRNRQLK